MPPDDYLDYLLLTSFLLWLLSSFCSPTLDYLLSISLAMAKSSGLSALDVLYSFSGFLVTQYLVKRFRPGNRVLADATTSLSWFTQRTSLSFNILDNAAQFSLNLRDLTSRLTVYCRDSIVLFPPEKPAASSTRELACAILHAIIIRGSLPSMLGNLIATDTLQRWMCDLAGFVALVIVLAPSLVLPGVSRESNVVNSIQLQEAAEVSSQGERTLIQTPSPNFKKKLIILVDRLSTPPRDRTPRRPILPSLGPLHPNSPNTAGDPIRPVIPLTSHDAGLSGANNTLDHPIDDSLPHLEVFRPLADCSELTSMNLPTSIDRIGSMSSSLAERLDHTSPEVVVEHASEELALENDTFSLNDLLSGEPEENLMENDMAKILSEISGDSEFDLLSVMSEELIATASVLEQASAVLEESEKFLAQFSTSDSPLAPSESEEVSVPMIVTEELSVQAKSVSMTQQPECVPLITVSAVDDSYGANDTFSLTDVLSSFASKQDDLLNFQEMRDDLANISLPQAHDSVALPAEKVTDVEACDVVPTEKCSATVVGLSSDIIVNNSVSSSKNRGHKRQRSSDDIIHTACGPFPLAKMPYELFSPASMRASEVASSLLSNEGRIRCADWRVGVDEGQQLLSVEQFAEEVDKDLAEFDKMQATLRSLMREHGLQTSATPPRVPSVLITQASPEKATCDRFQIQMPCQFPAFLEKAVPLTISLNTSSSSLVPSESVDSMYDPDFPGLNGKQADKYPKLNSDWPSDFPTEADTSDEWKLTQEMIDFWAARKAKIEAENPPSPVNIDDLSLEVDYGGENDRTFADFEDSMEYNYEEEQCLPGNSRLKCLGWRYEVIPNLPKPPQEPREHLVETVGNAILNQMCSIYSMYGKQDPDPTEEAPRPPSPPPPSPPRTDDPLSEPVVEPTLEPAPEPSSAPSSIALKTSAPLRRQSTRKVAPSTRVLRPRPSASAKTTAPERQTSRVPDPDVLSKLRPRASIAASRATVEKKVVPRQSLPLTAPKAAPRQSLAQSSVPPATIRQSIGIPKVAPRPSLPQSNVATKVSVTPPRTTQQSLAVPKLAPRQSLPLRQSLVVPKLAPRLSLQSSVAPKASVPSAKSLVVLKAAPRQSLPQSNVAPNVSVIPPRIAGQSLVAVPKAAPRPAPKHIIAAQGASITTTTHKSTFKAQPKSTTSLSASQTQTQPKSLTAVKRVPLAPIRTNVLRPSLPSTTTTTITNTALTQKSIPGLPPKRTSLAPPPAQTVPGDAPKRSAPLPSLTRLPARRTSIVSRR